MKFKKSIPFPKPDRSTLIRFFLPDPTSWSLAASNIITIFWASVGSWSLANILWVYWCQSVIIGFFSFIKILSLKDFSTAGLKINNQPAVATTGTQLFSAVFFLFHYGFFHLIYAFFLSANQNMQIIIPGFVLTYSIIFFANHLFSFIYHRTTEQKKVNLGQLIFFPYLRIIPMHLTIIIGGILGGAGYLIFFQVLKTFSDLAMHSIEHHNNQPNSG